MLCQESEEEEEEEEDEKDNASDKFWSEKLKELSINLRLAEKKNIPGRLLVLQDKKKWILAAPWSDWIFFSIYM